MYVQMIELYHGWGGFVFYEALAQELDDAYFESSRVVTDPADALTNGSQRHPDVAAVAFSRAFWMKPPLSAKSTRLTFVEAAMWFGRTSYADAQGVIAEAEQDVARGTQIWAYGANSNPKGVYPESWRSGRLERREVAAGDINADTGAAEATAAGAPGAGSDGADVDWQRSGGGGTATAMYAGITAAAAVVIAAIVGTAVYASRRRRLGEKAYGMHALPSTHGSHVSGSASKSEAAGEDAASVQSLPVELGEAGVPGREAGGSRGKRSWRERWSAGPLVTGRSFERAAGSGTGQVGVAFDTLGALSAGGASVSAREVGASRPSQTQLLSAGGGDSTAGSEETSVGSTTMHSARGAAVRGRVAAAVQEMQGALQAELQEDELKLYGVIGRGGFGTVYHGAPSPDLCGPAMCSGSRSR